jgi:hypothetical protein
MKLYMSNRTNCVFILECANVAIEVGRQPVVDTDDSTPALRASMSNALELLLRQDERLFGDYVRESTAAGSDDEIGVGAGWGANVDPGDICSVNEFDWRVVHLSVRDDRSCTGEPLRGKIGDGNDLHIWKRLEGRKVAMFGDTSEAYQTKTTHNRP